MFEQPSNNSFFQDNNAVLDVVYDITKDQNQYKYQITNNNFNNLNILEGKMDNIYSNQQLVNERITTETGSLFNSCKQQFDFFTTQISNVISTGTNFDTKVSNLERRVDGLYEVLKKFEQNINSRFESLEEFKVTISRIDQSNIHLSKQVDYLLHMIEKNDQKIDNYIFQKETLVTKNLQDEQAKINPLFNKKLEKIYQNMDQNLNSHIPSFNATRYNMDLNLEKSSSQNKGFDFSKTNNGFDFNMKFMKGNYNQYTSNKKTTEQNQNSDEKFTNANETPTHSTNKMNPPKSADTSDRIHMPGNNTNPVPNSSKFC